jgi:RNA polymerase sigma-70 factor, ECF subfamily
MTGMSPSRSVIALAELSAADDQVREAAWNHLAEWHGADVWRLIASRLRQAHEAEDAYQEFWLRLPQAAATFAAATEDDERKARAWLLRVAYNAATDRLRRRRPVRELVDDLPAQEDNTMAEREDRQRLVERVNRAIDLLPEGYRRPVLLHLVGGLSYEELAADLRCTVNNARVKVHRGVKRVRELLGVDDGELSEQGLAGLLVPTLMLPALPSVVPAAPVAATVPAASAAAAPAAGPLAMLTQLPVAIGVVAAAAATAAIALSGDPMPTVPAATALLAAGALSAAVVDDFERDAVAMIAKGQGGTACSVELVPAPAGGRGKALRLSWPAVHGMWADSTYTPQLPPLALTASEPQVATLAVWCEAFGGVKRVSIRFMDAKAEWFQWQAALPDEGKTGWRTIAIPVDWAKPQTTWGGNADKAIDWPLRFQGFAVELGSKEAPAGAVILDDLVLAAPGGAAK